MKQLCDWGDREGITLTLVPGRFDKGPLTTRRLRAWYRSFGFVKYLARMKREPRLPIAV